MAVFWHEKYKPTSLSTYLFQDDHLKSFILKLATEKDLPHLLFSGVQGTGKSTLAMLLLQELKVDPIDVLVINSSEENSVDVMRDKIKSFVSTYATGSFKVVLFEEADYLSHNAQGVLRRMMDEYVDNARFIFTCNYIHKIVEPLQSRCQHTRFKAFNLVDVTEMVAKILIAEKIKFTLPTLDKIVAACYPDIRKTINMVQMSSSTGTLVVQDTANTNDYKLTLLDLIESGNWTEARKVLCGNVSVGEWEDVYRFIYDNLHRVPQFKDQTKHDEATITVAEYLYKHAFCADPEINAAAMLIKLNQI